MPSLARCARLQKNARIMLYSEGDIGLRDLYLYPYRNINMDPNTVTQIWLDLATNAPFVGFLLYQYWDQRKTNKEQRDEMREIRTEAKAQEEQIREKFEKVIQQLNTDRSNLIDSFSGRIDSLERGQEKLLQLLQPIQTKMQEIEIERKIQAQQQTGKVS